jgi:glycosyltransferase involved in cell wall biosynthesis
MKIGVDAGALSIADNRLKLGVYWINVNLLRELGKIDKKNTYLLYSFTPIDREVMKGFGPRMRNKVLKPSRGWFSLRLPLELTVHPVDIFLGLSQAIPHSQSHNIGFIYDLGFLHYPEAYPGSQKKLIQITTDLIRRSDHIVTISRIVKDDIMKRYAVNNKKITVAYPGVDKTFTPIGLVYRGKRQYFLFVGALKRGKNIPTLLRAFAQFLKQSKKTYDLILVGSDYWLDPEISKTIKTLGIAKSIKQMGFVPDTKLAEFYRGALAFVSPSLWEGFCLPAVESMACGTPVIGSTTGAFPEIVGSAGILIDPADEQALTETLLDISSKKDLRRKLAKVAMTRSETFSWQKMAKTVYPLL